MDNEYRILEPEVAGGLGEQTVTFDSKDNQTIEIFHYEFQGWMGDELLTTHPCFIVTLALKETLLKLSGTGYSFGDVIVTKSVFFSENHPNIILPAFAWLKIHGLAGHDDAGLERNKRLVASSNLLNSLKQHNIKNCVIRKKPFVRFC